MKGEDLGECTTTKSDTSLEVFTVRNEVIV